MRDGLKTESVEFIRETDKDGSCGWDVIVPGTALASPPAWCFMGKWADESEEELRPEMLKPAEEPEEDLQPVTSAVTCFLFSQLERNSVDRPSQDQHGTSDSLKAGLNSTRSHPDVERGMFLPLKGHV
ncbi:hypothetical protein MHYP_G00208220 [Metynnis hypsauchen]